MSKPFAPTGTATGPNWEYRIERDGLFTDWVDWSVDLIFDQDPDGGDLRTGVLYWLYARNALLPTDEPGSYQKVLAASIELTESGRVVSATPDGDLTPEDSQYPVILTAPAEAQPLVLHWNTLLTRYELVNGVIPTLLNLTTAASDADLTYVADLLLPFSTGQIPGDERVIEAIFCYEDEEVVGLTVDNEHLFYLSADMIGTPQLHGFNLPGGRFRKLLQDAAGGLDQTMKLTFPDNTHFLINYPDGVSDYAGGVLSLKIIPTT
ncbi:hypothetical protein GO755_34765 [Spirosoma sp. HMF4905]|uniref:Uncharacterized protein n=1 Tax=Spirosoma arboris TaxID=2682092 RepID=A0A7K1SNS3_9BACT|nr:hypothetical protein [Spirosoma arboris]MVM35236.1 hypothetical protein [Spirosoma arboris]